MENPVGGRTREQLHTARVHLCKILEAIPYPAPITLTLLSAIFSGVFRMIASIRPPIVRMRLRPTPPSPRLVIPVIGIGSAFVFLPAPFAFALALGLRAKLLIGILWTR